MKKVISEDNWPVIIEKIVKVTNKLPYKKASGPDGFFLKCHP